MTFKSHLDQVTRHNVRTMRTSPLSEISGSMGDLGTLLPLLIAMTLTGSISTSATFVLAGLANISTGILFGVPIPVQPMKAIAAVAIEQSFSIRETAAAGLIVSAVIFILSISGLLGWLGRVVPVPIVRGIQMGAGLSLILSAGSSLLKPLTWTGPTWTDNHIWTLSAFVFLIICTSIPRARIPYALILTIVGVILAILNPRHHHLVPDTELHFHFWHPRFYIPSLHDFRHALPAAIGQVPLTTLNSILATSHLSHSLFPSEPTPSLAHLGLSLSITNFISCTLGGMPICHGSGGLASQYQFGARSGASVVILGTVKLLLGLFAGNGILQVLQAFPRSLLGIMVLGAGVELAKVAEGLNVDAIDLEVEHEGGRRFRIVEEQERKKRYSVMLITVAGILAFRNDAIGFLAGLAWHFGLNMHQHWTSSQRSWLPNLRSRPENAPLLGN